MSLPTAVTPSTGMPYFAPMSTVCTRLCVVICSLALSPHATITAIALTLRRITSSTSYTRLRLRSVRIVVPPSARRHTGLDIDGGITLRRMPRVHMRQSAYSMSGLIVRSTRSSPLVGPIMKPWSHASITVCPVFGLKMRARRFFTPQPWFSLPLRKNCSLFWGLSRP